jgi:hypothetical protein
MITNTEKHALMMQDVIEIGQASTLTLGDSGPESEGLSYYMISWPM